MTDTLGKRIARLRAQKGLKQSELAEALGVSAQAVSKWENDISAPDISILPDLARSFGVSIDELLTGEAPSASVRMLSADERRADKILHISVEKKGGDTMHLSLPFSLIHAMAEGDGLENVILKVCLDPKDAEDPREVDLRPLLPFIEKGLVGKIFEVYSNGDHLEVVVE